MTGLLELAQTYLTADAEYKAKCMLPDSTDLHARVAQDLGVRIAMKKMMAARDDYEKALDVEAGK